MQISLAAHSHLAFTFTLLNFYFEQFSTKTLPKAFILFLYLLTPPPLLNPAQYNLQAAFPGHATISQQMSPFSHE